jgi:WD40 repeat protein
MMNDKMIQNIEVLEQYQTIFSKEVSIQDLLRKFFKSMHEILYEIEGNKKLELDHVLLARLGSSVDMNQTQNIFQKLKSIQVKIDELIKAEEYEEGAKIRVEYKTLMGKADQNLDAFSKIRQYNAHIEQAFPAVFKFEGEPRADGAYPFPLEEIGSELTKIVGDYVKVDNLNLNANSNSAAEDKIKSVIGIHKVFKHNSEVTCILSLKNDMIVSGSSDSNIRIWDPENGKCVKILDGHTHTILCIIELESGYLASGSMDQTTIVWNPNNGKIINMLEGFQNPIFGMIELGNKQLVINFNEPMLLIWAWNTSSKLSSNSSTFSLGTSSLTYVGKNSHDSLI